jgi:hypothetical protein
VALRPHTNPEGQTARGSAPGVHVEGRVWRVVPRGLSDIYCGPVPSAFSANSLNSWILGSEPPLPHTQQGGPVLFAQATSSLGGDFHSTPFLRANPDLTVGPSTTCTEAPGAEVSGAGLGLVLREKLPGSQRVCLTGDRGRTRTKQPSKGRIHPGPPPICSAASEKFSTPRALTSSHEKVQ